MAINSEYPTKNRERLLVLDNIAMALQAGDHFRKVEVSDPEITAEDVKRVILPFDNEKRKFKNKILSCIARRIAEKETKKINKLTTIEGLENALRVRGGAMITCNHFNPMDNTVVRYMAMKCGKRKKLDIVIQERNVFMDGFFGFLMRNCNTMPVSQNTHYMARNFKPALKKKLNSGHHVLIYPEQEMWFNYKKPRDTRIGAYHFAAEFGVPIIPCFIEMSEYPGFDENGFQNIRYTLHIMPPIYPDPALSIRENREIMQATDMRLKKECYEQAYGVKLDEKFIPERDIAGYWE